MSLFEKRQHVVEVLENISAVLEGRSSHDVQSYQLAGQPIGKTPIPELLQLKKHYTMELIKLKRAERRKAGVDQGRIIKATFV